MDTDLFLLKGCLRVFLVLSSFLFILLFEQLGLLIELFLLLLVFLGELILQISLR